jgi:hypothetical protein
VVITFRGAFYGGLSIALCIGLYLSWLWRPERQVRLHALNFFHAIENKNWETVADFIAGDYQDQWGDDRTRVLERLHEGFQYIRAPRIMASDPSVEVQTQHAVWSGKVMLYSSDADVMEVLDQHVNALHTPFALEWRRFSRNPWDWKLTRVSNPGIEIPANAF